MLFAPSSRLVMKVRLDQIQVCMVILLESSLNLTLQFCFITFVSMICRAVVGCRSGIISRRNFEMVLSKTLENVNSVILYQCVLHVLVFQTWFCLIFSRQNSVCPNGWSCLKKFPVFLLYNARISTSFLRRLVE